MRPAYFWQHEHLSMKMAVANTTHETYNTNEGLEETVEHGLMGTNEAKLPVRAHRDTWIC